MMRGLLIMTLGLVGLTALVLLIDVLISPSPDNHYHPTRLEPVGNRLSDLHAFSAN